MKKNIYVFLVIIMLMTLPISVSASIDSAVDSLNHHIWMSENFADRLEAPMGTTYDKLSVSPMNGFSSFVETDLVIPGKNGLDVVISRSYNSINSPYKVESINPAYKKDLQALKAKYQYVENGSTTNYYIYFISEDDFFDKAYDGFYMDTSEYASKSLYGKVYSADGVYVTRDTTYEPRWEVYTESSTPLFDKIEDNSNTLNYNWTISLPRLSAWKRESTGFARNYINYLTLYTREGNAYEFTEDIVENYFDRSLFDSYIPEFTSTKEFEVISNAENLDDLYFHGVRYTRAIRDKYGKVMYFGSDRKILAEEDKYGNYITYQYLDDGILITDTMGRLIKLHETDGVITKVSVTVNGETKDLIYYDSEETNNATIDSTGIFNYDNDYLLKVTKIEGNETKEQSQNVTTYKMKRRDNIYYTSNGTGDEFENYRTLKNETYLLNEITNADGSKSVFNYGKELLDDSKKNLYRVKESYDEYASNNVTNIENAFDYTYSNSNNKNEMLKKRKTGTEYDGYTVTTVCNSENGNTIKTEIKGNDGTIAEFNGYSYSDWLKGCRTSSSTQIFNSTSTDYIEPVNEYEYDAYKNLIYQNTMGNEVWYDYGTHESDPTATPDPDLPASASETYNPYNILLSKTYQKDANTTIKIENTLTADHKSISDTKEYEKIGDGEFVLKNHTSYEYDEYGNLIKEIKRPSDSETIESNISYTYNDDSSYTVKQYVEDVTKADGSSIEKIETTQQYDGYGRLSQSTDGNGNRTSYTYDTLGRILSEKDLETNAEKTYTYSVSENYVIGVNENGTKVKQTYDMHNRSKKLYIAPPNGEFMEVQSISYDPASGQIETVRELGANDEIIETTYTWDSIGNLKNKTKKQNDVVVLSELYNTDIVETGTQMFPLSDMENVGWNNNTTKTVKNEKVISSSTQTFELNGEYKYLVMDVISPTFSNTNKIEIKSNGTVLKTLDSDSSEYEDESVIIDVSGLTSITITNEKARDVCIYNARLYTKEQIDKLGQKLTTTVTGDSTITPAVNVQYYSLSSNLLENINLNPTDNSELSKEIWEYDYTGNNVAYNDANTSTTSNPVQYTYDWAGRLLTENKLLTNGAGEELSNSPSTYAASSVTYDNIGRKLTETDSMGNTTTYTYDQLGRPITVNKPVDTDVIGVVKYEYDNNGNVITELVKSSKAGEADKYDKTEYEYDSRNRVIKTTQYEVTTASGNTSPNITQYYYDASGNLLRVYTGLTSPLTINGLDNVTPGDDSDYNVTKYEYNYMGYMTKMTSPMGYTEEYNDIDTLGNVHQKKDKNGDLLTYTYNWNGQTESITSSKDNSSVAYEYNVLGLRTKMTDESGVTTYTYDSLGRLTNETKGTVEKNYTYDKAGNRTSFEVKYNSNVILNNAYTYGWDNALFSMTATRGANSDTTNYTRNGNGQTIRATTGSKFTSYDYNASGLVSQMSETTNRSVKSRSTYTYNANGNIATETIKKNGLSKEWVKNYTYDGMNRLVSDVMTGEDEYQNTYSFDDYGNISTFGEGAYTYDSNNRLTSFADGSVNTTFTYDRNGNRYANIVNTLGTTEGTPDTSVSTEVTDNSGLHEYDGFNRLVKVENGNGTIEYTYNGDNLRTQKIVNGAITDFILDNGYVVAEIQGENITTYVWGEKLILSDTNGEEVHYNHNAHGDVVSAQTSGGTIITEYLYDAYGNELNPDSTDTNPFRYCGEYYDAETGYVYLRNRYYDPSIGSFITEDPARDGNNWYAYCGGNPVNRIDPWGLDYHFEGTEEDKVKLEEDIRTFSGDSRYYFDEDNILRHDDTAENTITTKGSATFLNMLEAGMDPDVSILIKYDHTKTSITHIFSQGKEVDTEKYVKKGEGNEDYTIDRSAEITIGYDDSFIHELSHALDWVLYNDQAVFYMPSVFSFEEADIYRKYTEARAITLHRYIYNELGISMPEGLEGYTRIHNGKEEIYGAFPYDYSDGRAAVFAHASYGINIYEHYLNFIKEDSK